MGFPFRSFLGALGLAILASLASGPAHASLIVQVLVTPAGGAFAYEVTVDNQLADDVVLVALVDAPAADALLSASLTAPVGYLATYDSGLGIVSFLEGTALFPTGVAVGGFSFTSAAAPGPGVFESFEALTSLGVPVTGDLQMTLVPEPAGLLPLGIGILALGRSRRRSRS